MTTVNFREVSTVMLGPQWLPIRYVVTAVFITNTVVMRGPTTAEWPGALVWAGDVA